MIIIIMIYENFRQTYRGWQCNVCVCRAWCSCNAVPFAISIFRAYRFSFVWVRSGAFDDNILF